MASSGLLRDGRTGYPFRGGGGSRRPPESWNPKDSWRGAARSGGSGGGPRHNYGNHDCADVFSKSCRNGRTWIGSRDGGGGAVDGRSDSNRLQLMTPDGLRCDRDGGRDGAGGGAAGDAGRVATGNARGLCQELSSIPLGIGIEMKYPHHPLPGITPICHKFGVGGRSRDSEMMDGNGSDVRPSGDGMDSVAGTAAQGSDDDAGRVGSNGDSRRSDRHTRRDEKVSVEGGQEPRQGPESAPGSIGKVGGENDGNFRQTQNQRSDDEASVHRGNENTTIDNDAGETHGGFSSEASSRSGHSSHSGRMRGGGANGGTGGGASSGRSIRRRARVSRSEPWLFDLSQQHSGGEQDSKRRHGTSEQREIAAGGAESGGRSLPAWRLGHKGLR